MVEYQLGIEHHCACCKVALFGAVSRHSGTMEECEEKILSLLAAVATIRVKAGDLCNACAAEAAVNAC